MTTVDDKLQEMDDMKATPFVCKCDQFGGTLHERLLNYGENTRPSQNMFSSSNRGNTSTSNAFGGVGSNVTGGFGSNATGGLGSNATGFGLNAGNNTGLASNSRPST